MEIPNSIKDTFVALPIKVLYDKNTTMNEKLILMEAYQLSSLGKGCIATNGHFSKKLCIPVKSVSRLVNTLKEKGYFNVEITAGSRNHERKIEVNFIVYPQNEDTPKMTTTPPQNEDTPSPKCRETKEKRKEIIKDTNSICPSTKDTLFHVWNETAKKNGIPTIKLITKERQAKINTRVKDLDDFSNMFIEACSKIENSQYLRGSRGWVISFDWLIENSNNVVKVLEGNYDDNKPNSKPSNLELGEKKYSEEF